MTTGPTFGPEFAKGTNEIVGSFNGLLASIYRFFRVPVADVAAAFDTEKFDPVDVPPGVPLPSPLPLNVLTICFLTYMCPGGNIHATTDGYGIIAQAFLEALP